MARLSDCDRAPVLTVGEGEAQTETQTETRPGNFPPPLPPEISEASQSVVVPCLPCLQHHTDRRADIFSSHLTSSLTPASHQPVTTWTSLATIRKPATFLPLINLSTIEYSESCWVVSQDLDPTPCSTTDSPDPHLTCEGPGGKWSQIS